MKISTKGRYGLLIMLYLGNEYKKDRYVTLKEISEKENISLKYLEKIMLSLNKNDFFISTRGVGGGYKLKKSPENYSLKEILKASEGDLSITNCISEICPKKEKCQTFSVWNDLNSAIDEFLENKTLNDYIEVKKWNY